MMKYRLQDLIDIEHFQSLQDRLNKIYSFPSSIIDNDGNILTATGWQDVCTKFHRENKETEQLCIKSDQYILDHIHEANPAVTYRCPYGLVDNAAPIIIDGIHYGNFFTGQFFLEEPDLDFFRIQAQKYGFDEEAYIAAVNKVPIWTQEQLDNYLFFIKGLIAVISESGMKKLKEVEHRKQIQKSEKRYRSILKAAIDGYWLTDPNGRLLEVNDAYCRMSGYNEEELLNMHISELEFVETPEIVAEHMQTVVMKGSDRFETRHRRKDGTVFDVEVSIQFRPEDGGQCVCFLRDITDTKQAEKALKESEERYNLAMDASKDGVYEWDLETRKIYYSPGWKRMLGYEPDELPDDFSVWEKLTRPEDVEKSWQIMKEVVEGNRERFEVEFQMRHKDGHWVHILSRSNIYKDANGKPVRVVGTHVDITDSINQRERLRLSESRYRKAQELGKVGNWEYNLKTTEFWGSDEAKKIFELDPYKNSFTIEEVESCIIERERVHQALVDLIENRKPYNLEYDIITKNTGKRKTFVSIAEIETDGAKNPVKVSGVIHDITERKQADENLKKSEARHGKMLANIGDVIVIIDQDGINRYKSPNIEKLFGWKPGEVVGKSTWDNVHPDDIEPARKFFEKIMHKPDVIGTMECRYRCKDGSYKWIQFTGINLFHDPDIQGLLGNYQDITERKQAEKLLIEKEALFRGLFDHMTSGSAVYEVRNDGSKGTDYIIREFNRKSLEMEGKKMEEVLGRSLFDLRPNIDDYGLIPAMKKVWETGSPEYFPTRIYQDDNFSNFYENHIFKLPSGEVVTIYSDVTDQKNQEKELKESEEKFRLMAENMSDVITLMDLNLRFTYVSPSIKRLTGFSVEDALKFSIEDIIPPDSFQEILNIIKEEITTEANGKQYPDRSRIIEYKQYKKDKTTVWVESNCRLLRDRDQKPSGFLVISRDITERKEAEEALKSNYALLQIAGETAIFGGWSVDLEKNICTWSDAVADIHDVPHGYSPPVQEAINFYAPEWREKITHIFSACAKDGIPYDEEMEIITQKGKRVWVRATGKAVKNEKDKIIKVQGSFQDITDKKQAEEALRESEEKLQALFSAMTEMVVLHQLIFDDKGIPCNYRILDCNQAFCRITKIKKETAVGKKATQVYNTDSAPYLDVYAKVALSGEPVEFVTYYDFMDKHFLVSVVSPRKNFFATITSDITEIRRAEAEREKLQAQLNQAQKLESVGRLAGGVAHDFNNMLGVILGHTELALLQVDENHDLYSDLNEIQTAAKRSADITKQLLAFARKEIISPKQLDLNDTVESMLNMLRRLIGEDIDLSWLPARQLWPVKIDPSQIDQILVNLCVNARDAIAGVGKLTIETGKKSFDEEYCKGHPGFVPGDFVLLAVSDNGCGMDKETLENLFEPFFTTKEVGKGTGLGLATIYGIVKQNNGFINVYSEPGQGATFKIYLPRLVANEATDMTMPEKKAAIGGTETILLVEDEPSILRMTRMMLERKGYNVLSSATPADAVEKATNHFGAIDLLMTDVVMPEMNGRDLAAKVKVFHPDIRLLFMSGYTADVIAHQGVLDAGVAFIQKPFSLADMTEKVRNILDSAPNKN
jgi:PAS domain S-box-containing protein